MEFAQHFEWILGVREQARGGRSGTGVARWLLREQGLDQFRAYQVVMDAFGMNLRDARELEALLARPASREERLLDAAWEGFLSNADRWPRRVLRLTREGTRPLTMTFHLFDFASPGSALHLD
ncbi:hypothetical protein [Deinococcus hopiensis]|nr:hypothetical protein [Deinococcus hopiensis]